LLYQFLVTGPISNDAQCWMPAKSPVLIACVLSTI